MADSTHSRKHIHQQRTFGERAADVVAAGMGSWTYIIGQTVFIILWMTLNTLAFIHHWDGAPFILLNLIFSIQASYAAPILQLSGNRQAAKDRMRDDHEADEVDLLFRINQQQLEILHLLRGKLGIPEPTPVRPTKPGRDARGRFIKKEKAA